MHKIFLTLISRAVTTDWPREHRLCNGARCNSKLPGRETDWGGGEENPAGKRRRGTEQPHEGQCVNISLCYVTKLEPGIENLQLTGFPILYQVLENRTKDSKMEMEVLENLQELKELNQRQAQVDYESMIDKYREMERREREREQEEDERETKLVFK